jgi:hypothetical protein
MLAYHLYTPKLPIRKDLNSPAPNSEGFLGNYEQKVWFRLATVPHCSSHLPLNSTSLLLTYPFSLSVTSLIISRGIIMGKEADTNPAIAAAYPSTNHHPPVHKYRRVSPRRKAHYPHFIFQRNMAAPTFFGM